MAAAAVAAVVAVAEGAQGTVAVYCGSLLNGAVGQKHSWDLPAHQEVRIEMPRHGLQGYHQDCGLRLTLSRRLVGVMEWFPYYSGVEVLIGTALCAADLAHFALFLFLPFHLVAASVIGVPPFHALDPGSEDRGEVGRSSLLIFKIYRRACMRVSVRSKQSGKLQEMCPSPTLSKDII